MIIKELFYCGDEVLVDKCWEFGYYRFGEQLFLEEIVVSEIGVHFLDYFVQLPEDGLIFGVCFF